jgi:Lon protease-like protein
VSTLPLFPLRSVLCPGVALPLHIFEERYRLMIARCLERDEPFGVVLLREGREVGPHSGAIAAVGTSAIIRRAGRYADGRLDILSVGQQRFRLDAVDSVSEPYLVGSVTFLDEPVGPDADARGLGGRVGRRFLEYLRLLQTGEGDGPDIEIEFEIEVDDDEPGGSVHEAAGSAFETLDDASTGHAAETDSDAVEDTRADLPETLGDDVTLAARDVDDLDAEQRSELLMTAARRLLATEDPTALSYVLTALVQVDLASRQRLLEVPTTVERLSALDGLLAREVWLLRQGLRPIIVDPASLARRTQ